VLFRSDDKILKRISESKESFQQHINRYTQSYLEDRLRLGIAPADVHPLATQHIQEMIELIERLVERGVAYETEDGIYFGISKFEGYGKLSGISKEGLEAGSSGRVSKDEYNKEEIGDFVLWKKSRPGEPYWHSPWGTGRPGWHIECSAMAMKYLGESLDIHCGGEEHIFPHHENEIAQSEAATGKPFAKYWLHVRHLLLDGRKMSKSTGEFVSVREAVQRHGALSLRIFLLSTHYRKTMTLNQHAIQISSKHADDLHALWAVVKHYFARGQSTSIEGEDVLLAQLNESRSVFEQAMNRDLSTPLALSAILELARETAGFLDKHGKISKHQASLTHSFLKSTGTVLFGDLIAYEFEREQDKSLDSLVSLAIEHRKKLRKQGRYDDADLIRNRLKDLGIVLQDLSDSTLWRQIRRREA
jgi:cysteinyl-tRNA synthetase